MNRILSSPWFVVAAAAIILAVNMGIRQTTGIMLPEISLDLNLPRAELSFGFAIQNLLWGAVAPFAGLLAERYGLFRVMSVGALLYAAGMVLAALASSGWMFFAGNALLIGVGVGATTYPLALAAVGKRFAEHNRTFALGVASAGGSLGQFLYAFALGQIDAAFNWSEIFLIFASSIILIVLFSRALLPPAQADTSAAAPAAQPVDWRSIGAAFKVRDYQLLNLGFFVCGFHIAFLSVHMSGIVAYCGLPASVASESIALIGLANVAGVILAGWAGDRWHKPWLLSLIYWLRACLIMLLLVVPASETLFYLFSVIMGVLWLSTVPLTSGTVARIFGPKNLASLFGFVMFSHQIGAFFGSWWGGLIFDATGSYDLALIISAALGLFAAFIHLPITPARLQQYRPAT
ncbi:MFS transporter [Aliamphritea hakodatensis]|uniref:MFS transporter n=1 Tax=Aliamphritea hakodatensis TaxID=2895352 RepID=UPI0022FD7AD9|nr:MFS transporter [Aliamphritea hakodatensis]